MMEVTNPVHGVHIYANAIPNGTDIINRLESVLDNSSDELFRWTDSTNLMGKDLSSYRRCFDLKMHPDYWQFLTPEFEEIKNCYEEIDQGFLSAITHYKDLYNLKIPFKQGVNFMKYGEGHHFVTHVDNGSSYSSVVSALAYLNNDYEGGELGFPLLDFEFKPEAGDIVLFPSSFMHAHKVNVVKSGLRYSAGTWWDYSNKFHPKIKPSRKGIPKIYNNDNDWVEGEGFISS